MNHRASSVGGLSLQHTLLGRNHCMHIKSGLFPHSSFVCRREYCFSGINSWLTVLFNASASPLEIQAFQPAVVPIRAITTLTLQTKGELNVTSNSSLQCRFKDISVPARMEDGFIFCDTPPMRNIDRVSVHLDVDGKLFKTKKPLYFHGEMYLQFPSFFRSKLENFLKQPTKASAYCFNN